MTHAQKTRPTRRMLVPFEEFTHFFDQLKSRDRLRSFHSPDPLFPTPFFLYDNKRMVRIS